MNHALTDRLRSAVPEAPHLDGLASAAEAQGRHRRTRSRVVTGGALLLVAAALAIPSLLLGDDGAPDPAPQPKGGPECLPSAKASTDEITAEVVPQVTWVRLCGTEDGQTGGARFPDAALTTEARSFVEDHLDALAAAGDCSTDPLDLPEGRRLRIQVGLAGGGAVQLASSTECAAGRTLYLDLVSQLSSALDDEYEDGGPSLPATCPDRLRTDRNTTDGASVELFGDPDPNPFLSSQPILALPARSGLVCRYTGYANTLRLDWSWLLDTDAQEILLDASIGYREGMVDCSINPARPSYLVALRDRTGTTRTFTIDGPGCGPMSAAIGAEAQEQYLGLADQDLLRSISRSGSERPQR